ncbi:MAG TPA: DNA repair exonuclease [Caulobacteraceae bacterium]|nr:DNA repair exonuclease [Caulobacteraceae bacterium]
MGSAMPSNSIESADSKSLTRTPMKRDFTFVHTADIHLDSPLTGLARKDEGFSRLVRGATRRAFSNVVDLAIDEGAGFVVIAGDLYDGTWKDQNTGQFAVSQLSRLSRAGIRTFIVFGNHDAESRISRHLTMPPGVHLLSNKACETVFMEEFGVAIHGRSYKEVATTEDLAASYCAPNALAFNIALLHTALGGNPPHENYAPCTLDRLRSSGHQYWALGHVHEHAVRSRHPFVVYPGNTQGRHARETGAKGAVLVRVSEGEVQSVEHRACDEVRFARAEIDGVDARDMTELLAAVGEGLAGATRSTDGRPVAVRVIVRARDGVGRGATADREWFDGEVQAIAAGLSESLWIEKVTLTAVEDGPTTSLLPELDALLAVAMDDEDCAHAVRAAVAPLLGKLPADLRDPDLSPLLWAAREQDDRTLVAAARRLVEARLAGEGG